MTRSLSLILYLTPDNYKSSLGIDGVKESGLIIRLTFFLYHSIMFAKEMGFLSGKRLFAERVARFFFYVYNIIQI